MLSLEAPALINLRSAKPSSYIANLLLFHRLVKKYKNALRTSKLHARHFFNKKLKNTNRWQHALRYRNFCKGRSFRRLALVVIEITRMEEVIDDRRNTESFETFESPTVSHHNLF
jgi:hypothetical protein